METDYHKDAELQQLSHDEPLTIGPMNVAAEQTERRHVRRLNLLGLWENGLAVARARWYLRSATLGERVRVWGRLVVANRGQLVIANRVKLSGTIVPIQLATGPRGKLEIGERVSINYGCSIGATELVHIGARSRLGPYVMVVDNSFHHLEPELRHVRPPSAPVILEDDVWLGARVIVLPGVRMGAGSVAAAGSVVTRDVPPRTLVAGSPARVVRTF